MRFQNYDFKNIQERKHNGVHIWSFRIFARHRKKLQLLYLKTNPPLDDDSWENEHDFILYIFPNDKPSNFNTDRLVVDAKKSQDLGSFDNNLKIYSGTLNF